MKPSRKCRHCQAKNVSRPLGLCHRCYYTPAVRAVYQGQKHKFAPKGEPTQEEVDRMVAEGYANLPAWWDKESQRTNF